MLIQIQTFFYGFNLHETKIFYFIMIRYYFTIISSNKNVVKFMFC